MKKGTQHKAFCTYIIRLMFEYNRCVQLIILLLFWSNLLYGQHIQHIDATEKTEERLILSGLKGIKLGENTTLSIGGDYRFQAESFINEEFGSHDGQDNAWLLNRIMLNTDWNFGKNLNAFVELSSSTVIGKDDLTAVDKDVLAFNQIFVQYKFMPELQMAVGRKNLSYGSGRLVDVRNLPNVRRSFDLLQLKFKKNTLEADIFTASIVRNEVGVLDNDFFEFKESFYGFHFSDYISGLINLDAYYFFQKQNDVVYNNITGNERRSAVGIHHYGTLKGWSYNNEIIHQFGSFEDSRISALAYYFQVEYAFRNTPNNLKTGLKFEVIDGDDDPADNKVGTFDAFYPKGAYFGRVARFGPSNLIDIHPYVNFKKDRFFYEFDIDFFWRESTKDGVYNPALQLEYPSLNNQPYIGTQLGTFTSFELNEYVSLELETNFIFPGSFLKESGLTNSLFHFVFTTEFKF
ncbi:alginate export family protein [Flagellimonas myxillae]|uniref:alginate export family protein n=1 Tax=Flagellimonas myxillae TaxID=2942214 RepID=UPI00201F1E8C|nr:alginate export family protein [Muricauda myxillae]MCL6267750.1 alginate export family protein [Muricauda myxillae]